jgi:hypothetical protein
MAEALVQTYLIQLSSFNQSPALGFDDFVKLYIIKQIIMYFINILDM